MDRRHKVEQLAVAREHITMGRSKPVQQVAAEGTHQVGRRHTGLARQRADHRHHLFVRVVAHGGVGAAMGRRHFVDDGVGDFRRELVFDQLDEFGEHKTQHERSRKAVRIAEMLGPCAAGPAVEKGRL